MNLYIGGSKKKNAWFDSKSCTEIMVYYCYYIISREKLENFFIKNIGKNYNKKEKSTDNLSLSRIYSGLSLTETLQKISRIVHYTVWTRNQWSLFWFS
jgi:hypothetical protein